MPGVLILHAWWGLNDDVRAYARRLQGEGFVVETPDQYDGKVATEIPGAEALMKARDKGRGRAVIDQAADRLAKQGPFAVVGWSMGGSLGWDLVDRRPGIVAAIVDHYGGGDVGSGALPAILGHYGELDDDPSPEMVRKFESDLRRAGATPQFHLYAGAKHWFAEPSRPQYDSAAAELAWQRTLAFLRRTLRSGQASTGRSSL